MASDINDRRRPRNRGNNRDLIDLSKSLETPADNSLYKIFDPLLHDASNQETETPCEISNTGARRTSKNSSLNLELKKRDRRFSITNITSVPPGEYNAQYKNSSSVQMNSEPLNMLGSSNLPEASIQPLEELIGVSCKKINKLDLESNSAGFNSRDNSEISFKKDEFKSDHLDTDSITWLPDVGKKSLKLDIARKHQRSNRDLSLLTHKVKSFRSKFKYNDRSTNLGYIYSPTLYSSSVREMSVKIAITSPLCENPINFTCNASTVVEHLISHAVCTMFDHIKEDDNMENYLLKVTGKEEFLDSKLCLADYAHISHCWKFDLDVKLTLIKRDDAKRPFLRVSQDDYSCSSRLCPDDLLSQDVLLRFRDLNFEHLNILIETFESEAQHLYDNVSQRSNTIQTTKLLQTTKAICSLMMNCETSQLTESMNNLVELCKSYKKEGGALKDEDRYMMIEVIQHAITKLIHNMHRLLKVFSSFLPVDYEVLDLTSVPNTKRSFVDYPINMLREQISLKIEVLSNLKPEWIIRYQEFHLRLGLMHGDTTVCPEVATTIVRIEHSLFNRILFDQELVLSAPYSEAPREARFVMTLFGTQIPSLTSNQLTVPISEDHRPMRRAVSSSSITSTTPVYQTSPQSGLTNRSSSEPIQTVLATSMAYLFDQDFNLRQGDVLLSMHTLTEDCTGQVYFETTPMKQDPVLLVEFKKFPLEKKIYFPAKVPQATSADLNAQPKAKLFEELDTDIKHMLNSIIDKKQVHEVLTEFERDLIWKHRLYLMSKPTALPKVLRSAPSWSLNNLRHIYDMVDNWSLMQPADSMQLLLPSIADVYVREKALESISKQHDDELCDYLPQLLQSLRYEMKLDCPLLWILIEKSLRNPRIANLLYWQLKLNSTDVPFRERCEVVTNCIRWLCGNAFWKSLDKQEELLYKLSKISKIIKESRESHRMELLLKNLEDVQDYLIEHKPAMPWAPSLEVCDLELKSCSYFQSKTLPLKLAFRSCEQSYDKSIPRFYSYPAIFKEGDDLRQDMLAIQMIRIMEKLWLRDGLDLRIVTFDCLATGERQGMVEMVQNAETLRKIQQNSSFLAGPFKSKAIDDFIRLWNTSEPEYMAAVDNFVHSCAGYAVATYILGICDRHNDNIMVTTSGHLFHIDFGKFLGDAQMLGSIKRDRTPFVLTVDMAYVINGGDRPSKKFQRFIDLCNGGFNIIRKNRNIFLNLFALMSSSNINGLNSDSVNYINRMLMPELTEIEAMAKFTRLIEDCLSSRSTQVNFFIHNLGQLKFSNDNSKQSLLSFVPKTFTCQTDGKIESLDIVTFYKIYEPEKQYYYVVRIARQGQPDITEVHRTFREFSELQIKLTSMFPYQNFHNINKSGNSFITDLMVRTNTREVAERRLVDLRIFVGQLSSLPPEISHCDLIYTFFHPILRDHQSSNPMDASITSESSTFGAREYTDAQRAALYLGSNGLVKLSLSYKNGSLIVMIMHAKNLVGREGLLSLNCYAKTYLVQGSTKQMKQKTRVVKQSCHPSFMELIVYKLPLEKLKQFRLEVSIWHSELVHNKVLLGATLINLNSIDLSKDTTAWYPLKNA